MPILDLLFRDEYVKNDVREARLLLCYSCPSLLRITKRCQECGCFVKLKTELKKEYCPLLKWGEVN